MEDACGRPCGNGKVRNISRCYRVGGDERAASKSYAFGDHGMSSYPRSMTDANWGKRTGAITVRAIFQRVIAGNQHGVGPQLHLVFDNDSAPGMNPASGRNVDVAADLHAIREVN